ncbi:LacI family DNA-binding transcriptional regulator [Reyranella sp. CPCC 100927]|uniref:LacI family DNA-binding transcriptional regulator n=1 Tax=Reyranella sp. CPCC 100927 TaxID=2599616 RepID=UPI0011B494BF|nr:LacI family DNA-binding transcriptional regulator [Reyranella sp. CPCC 100927]TWS98487.1 substrate-binding domain-containing protein [Reyranella sp. CPCC 100927]
MTNKHKAPTQRDVARVAGVSQAAVSRWISGRGYVASDVRERILKAVAELNYEPHPLARGLSSGQSDIIAIVLSSITNPWYPIVLNRITHVLQAMRLQVLLFNAAPPQSVDDVLPSVLRYRVKGVLITTASLSSKAALMCAEQGVPVVLFNRSTRAGGVHSVSCDNADGGRMAADTLVRAGARKLGYIGGLQEASTSADRQRGFVSQLAEWGIDLVAAIDKEFTYDWGFEATLKLFEKHPQIDGLFCADDEIGSGAVDALRYRLNKSIPGEVKVIGFDDHPVASNAAYQLTTIRQPVDEMIENALDVLLNGDMASPSLRLLKGELIKRGSA